MPGGTKVIVEPQVDTSKHPIPDFFPHDDISRFFATPDVQDPEGYEFLQAVQCVFDRGVFLHEQSGIRVERSGRRGLPCFVYILGVFKSCCQGILAFPCDEKSFNRLSDHQYSSLPGVRCHRPSCDTDCTRDRVQSSIQRLKKTRSQATQVNIAAAVSREIVS